MARRTLSFVSSLMDGLFLQVRETVDGDTPASAATSLMVTDMGNLLGVDYAGVHGFIVVEIKGEVNVQIDLH